MNNPTESSLLTRKARLIEEGAAHRSDLLHAAQAVKANLRETALTKNALSYLAIIGADLLKGRTGLVGIGVQTVLPLLISGLSTLTGNPLLKTILRSTVIAGTVGAIVGAIIRKRKASAHAREAQMKSRG